MLVALEALIVGRRYKIVIDDCCIKGMLRGTFLGWKEEEEEDLELIFREAMFDFGKIDGWAWKAYALDAEGQGIAGP